MRQIEARLEALEAHRREAEPVAPIAVGIEPQTKAQAIERHSRETGQTVTQAVIIRRVCARLPGSPT